MASTLNNTCRAFQQANFSQNYVSVLQNKYGDQVTEAEMAGCKTEICLSLYGEDNGDVTGIGVLIGYYFEIALALILGSSMLLCTRLERPRLSKACREVTVVFADSAISLALAVELASAIMLIRKNFGLFNEDFGALTVEIVWIVALLVMLPVATFCWQDLRDSRFELRLCVIAMTYILFMMTFISQLINRYSDEERSSGGQASQDIKTLLDDFCLTEKYSLSDTEAMVVQVFSIGGGIWLSVLVLAALAKQLLKDVDLMRTVELPRFVTLLSAESWALSLHMVALIFWSVPMYWALMVLREKQRKFADDVDAQIWRERGQWSFGQVLAVVVFAPVFVEVWHQILSRHDGRSEDAHGHYGRLAGDPRQEKTW